MKLIRLALALFLVVPVLSQQPESSPVGVLSTTEIQRLMPPSVFFEGQTATIQFRNSFGVRFPGGGLVLAGVVDTGGYSTAVRDRYQFYLLSDTPFEAVGKRLAPGAYGCGFRDGNLVVMDLGANEILRTPVTRDEKMLRPRPLQMLPGQDANEVRLYLGRDFVAIRKAR